MKILVDLHCHTDVSAHAYSTIKEYAEMAAEYGLEGFAVTNHGPGSADGAHIYHFGNLRVVPRTLDGVTILRGVECDILSSSGEVCMEPRDLKNLDIVIASIHQSEYGPQTEEEHTEVLLNVMDNPYINIMGHMDRERLPFDIDRVIKKAKETGKLIEINSSSLKWGEPTIRRCRDIALACKKYEVPVVANSDSHICYDVGNVDNSIKLLESINFDKNLIMNTNLPKITKFLNLEL